MLKYVAVCALLLLPACDKALHYSVGFAISTGVTEVTKSKELGCAAAVVAGAAKEFVDIIPDPFDFLATAAGGCYNHQTVFGPHQKE